MIKLQNDDTCMPSKMGHMKFLKKLIQTPPQEGSKCNLCYKCGDRCHEPIDEKFITDEDSLEYQPSSMINKYIEEKESQLKSEPSLIKTLNGKKYKVFSFRYVVAHDKSVKYEKSNTITAHTELSMIVPKLLYPVYRQYIGILADDNACHCMKHQNNRLSSIVKNLVYISDRSDLCRQCGHEHHGDRGSHGVSCIATYSVVYPGVDNCSCTKCMCFNCLENMLPPHTSCCGYTEPTLDDCRKYIMKNAVPHKYLF